ncbi:MAG: type II toxin-antitoxin system MqsA family antitoxin [Gallionella sp.]|nr:type II toxin-antitoxin system MqsA family antitoxin [Gallionella sp.]
MKVTGWHCPVCGDIEFTDNDSLDRVWKGIEAMGEKAKARDAALLAHARKRLKLTQKQAAELTGGGHNAFSPVSFYNPECSPPAEAGIALAGTKIFFPLSSRALLLMRHPECRSEHPLKVLAAPTLGDGVVSITHGTVWNKKVVTSTNWKLSQLTHHFVVAENKEVLKQCGAADLAPMPLMMEESAK